MIEINVTNFVNNEEPKNYSASRAELGDDAGEITWNNAMKYPHELLKTDEERQEMQSWLQGTGGWADEEVMAFTNRELNALFIQNLSAIMRESEDWNPDWSGQEFLFKHGDEWFYTITD